MSFAILRIKKIKQSGLGGMTSHIDRTRDTPNADKDLSSTNEVLAGVQAKGAMQGIKERIKAIEAQTGKKVRKDAVACIEVVQTASPAFFLDKTPEQVRDWGNKSVDWLKGHFGGDNLISATLHLDETTPHIHAMIIPVNEKGKLCAKDFCDGRDKLSAMQDSYGLAMQPLELVRGKKGSKAKHMDLKEWYGQGLAVAKKEALRYMGIAKSLKGYICSILEKDEMWHVKTPVAVATCKALAEFELNTVKYKQPEVIQDLYTACRVDFLEVTNNDFLMKKFSWVEKFKEKDKAFGEVFSKTLDAVDFYQYLSEKEKVPPIKIKEKTKDNGIGYGD